MADLFGYSPDNISLHLKNIFKDKELDPNSVAEDFSATAADGKNYKTKFYNLDAIIAVGYRVNSYEATQFRIWATKTLREFIIKVFVLDAERQIPVKMADWVTWLDAFLQFNEYQILNDAGKVSHEVAMKLADAAYEKFRVIQDQNFVSDFEMEVKNLTK